MYRFVFLSLILCCSCAGKKQMVQDAENALMAEAKERYDDRFVVKQNETNDYSIIRKKYKSFSELLPSIAFFVFDHRQAVVIHEDSLTAGFVEWYSSHSIKAISRKRNEADEIYYFDVLERRKTSLK